MNKADVRSGSETKRTAARLVAQLTSTARIDAPHEVPGADSVSTSDVCEPAASAVPHGTDSEQLRLQADQLAAYLRGRQEELDRREAELNSRTARLESDTRGARLWIDEHQVELIEKGQTLSRQEEELAARMQALAEQETEWAARRDEVARRELELSDRQRELSRQEQEVKVCLARLAVAEEAQHRATAAVADKSAELQQAAEQIESQTDRLRQSLADLTHERQAVQRQADQLDQSRAVLEQLRDELGSTHRETLEIRLATEELWAQLSGAAPPAALVRSLGRIRAQLTDQYRQAAAEVAEQKKELEAIRGQLADQHRTIVEHRERLEQWAVARQDACERHADRLVAREQELHRQETEHRQQSAAWQAERSAYQREIRRLRAKK